MPKSLADPIHPNPVPISDEQAMWRVQMNDDSEAFGHLVERWEKAILRLCARMTGDQHRAEDLKQEIFARVFARRQDFRTESRFSTWLEGWRQSINQLRRLDWPAAHPPAAVRSQSQGPFQWTAAAAAAAIVLGLGFLLGRFSGPDPERLREALAADLKVDQEAAAVRLSNDFARAVHTFRTEDREAWLGLAADLQRQQTADYLSLRKDLETVASVAEASLRRADWRLTEIVSTTQTDPNP